jgi:hypothetical protein
MDGIVGFGEKWREIAELASYKHEYFFKYLQISPSYQLAHRKIALKEKIAKTDLPEDFDLVLDTYKKAGDVFSVNFIEWWVRGGNKLFAREKGRKRLIISFDSAKSKKQLMQEFESLIDKAKLREKDEKKEAIKFLVNKVRFDSLRLRHNLIEAKADFYFNKKKEEYWKLAKFVGLTTKWTKTLRLNSKKTSLNLGARNYLGVLVSKNIREGLHLAENAARGVFPCIAKIDSALSFDHGFIKEQANRNTSRAMKLMLEHKNDKDFIKYVDPSNSLKRTRKIDESTMLH